MPKPGRGSETIKSIVTVLANDNSQGLSWLNYHIMGILKKRDSGVETRYHEYRIATKREHILGIELEQVINALTEMDEEKFKLLQEAVNRLR